MRKTFVAMIGAALVALLVAGAWSFRALHRSRVAAWRQVAVAGQPAKTTPARKRPPGIGGIVLPPSRPVYRVEGKLAADVTVVAEPSAEQWARHLRDKVCACRAAACASEAQHVYARSLESLDFASGDRAATDRLMHEAAACTSKLLDAERDAQLGG